MRTLKKPYIRRVFVPEVVTERRRPILWGHVLNWLLLFTATGYGVVQGLRSGNDAFVVFHAGLFLVALAYEVRFRLRSAQPRVLRRSRP